jgi:hypothetical protein
MIYKIYATNDNGEGIAQELGCYKDLADINIHIGMLKEDVVISIAEEEDDIEY